MGEDRVRILSMVADGKISVAEGEKLLTAIEDGGASDGAAATATAVTKRTGPLKFLRVTVNSQNGDNVNVKVPLALLRAGMKLTSLIPPQAMEKVNASMQEQGINFDLNSMKQEDIEAIIESLADMEVNVDSANGDTVKVFCE